MKGKVIASEYRISYDVCIQLVGLLHQISNIICILTTGILHCQLLKCYYPKAPTSQVLYEDIERIPIGV